MRGIHKMLGLGGVAIVAAVLASGCIGGAALGFADGPLEGFPRYGGISPEEAVSVIVALQDDPDFVLLDIRTPEEVETGHLPGASNLDYRGASFEQDLGLLDRNLIYLIYCRTANRTGQAFDLMTQMGFTRIYDMQGGIRRWSELGYPICKGPLGEEHACVGDYPSLASGV